MENPDFHVDLDPFGGERCYSRLTSKQSIQFFHKLLMLRNMQIYNNTLPVVCGFFLTLKFSCLFTAVSDLVFFSNVHVSTLDNYRKKPRIPEYPIGDMHKDARFIFFKTPNGRRRLHARMNKIYSDSCSFTYKICFYNYVNDRQNSMTTDKYQKKFEWEGKFV